MFACVVHSYSIVYLLSGPNDMFHVMYVLTSFVLVSFPKIAFRALQSYGWEEGEGLLYFTSAML